MDRHSVVVVILVAFAAVALWCSVLMAATIKGAQHASEPAAWQRLLRPLVPPLLVGGAVLGWAVADKDDCEVFGITLSAAAATATLIVFRAVVRAVRAAWVKKPGLAGTVGIFAPAIYVSSELASELDERALAALMTHEQAHARHRDPARQLLAQFVTDLQWPLPGAHKRWTEWRQALEIARDDEALERGVAGVDLAHAIVTCARLTQRGSGGSAVAGVLGASARLSRRVERLLTEPTPRVPGTPQRCAWVHTLLGLTLSFLMGLAAGDEVVEALLLVLP